MFDSFYDLPEELVEFCRAHDFQPTEKLPGGHCSKLYADQTRVLKVPFQGEEMDTGLLASRRIEAVGGPKIDAWSDDPPALLMERLVPGCTLSERGLSPAEREEVFLSMAAKMRTLPTDGTMELADFLIEPQNCETVSRWRIELIEELTQTATETTFLHNDLHHGNILFDGTAWRPTDPKGVRGDPHYECVAFLRNPIHELKEVEDLIGFTRSRLLSIAEATGFSPWRIAAWGRLDMSDSGNYESTSPWERLGAVYKILIKEFQSV